MRRILCLIPAHNEAANLTAVVAEVRSRRPDVDILVTDVVMPGSSGPSLFRRLVVDRPGMKVLYMSGYTDDEVVVRAGLGEGAPFLQKPFTADALLCKVREALER